MCAVGCLAGEWAGRCRRGCCQLDRTLTEQSKQLDLTLAEQNKNKDAAVSWQGLSLDFNGVVFDGGDFRGAEFSDSLAVFDNAEFSGGTVRFNRARFSGDRRRR